MSTLISRKALDDGSPSSRKRPRLSNEHPAEDAQDVARNDSFSDGFFGSDIDFNDEALQMVDDYDVFQPEPEFDVTCIANSGDDPFVDGMNQRAHEDEDEVPSSQGEADSGDVYTIGKIHGECLSSSQSSARITSPTAFKRVNSRNFSSIGLPVPSSSLADPSTVSERLAEIVSTLHSNDEEKEADIDFGAYTAIPTAVGFASTSAVLSDPNMPAFIPASQVPIDRTELASSSTRSNNYTKSIVKLAGGGGALKPISAEDIKASADKLMGYQQDTHWKPQPRVRNIPSNPPVLSFAASKVPTSDEETDVNIDFGALVKSTTGFSSASTNTHYGDTIPTFMPASQVPIDRSEITPSSILLKPSKKSDILLAGGSGGLMPLTEEQIKASAEKLMAYQQDTKWRPQVRTRVPRESSSNPSNSGPSSSRLDQTDSNDPGIELLESVDDMEHVEPAFGLKGKGKQRAVTPPSHAANQPMSPPRNILRAMENLDDLRPESSHATSRPTALPVIPSRESENPFSNKTQPIGTPAHRPLAAFRTPVRSTQSSRLSTTNVASNVMDQTPIFSQVGSSTQTPLLSQTAPSTLHRLGLSQRKPNAKTPGFMTPFKRGMAPGDKGRETLEMRNRTTPSRGATANGLPTSAKPGTSSGGKGGYTNSKGTSGIARALQAEKERQFLERAVFDTRPVLGRKGLREAGVVPLSAEKRIPASLELNIPYLSLKAASDFSFPQGGHIEALKFLHENGCNLAEKDWVKNHWGQVIWKLAGTARTGVELSKGKWSWEEASKQMLYRYEREINRAERPAIRQIQERDASAARAMILCISDVRLQDNEEVEIELTDGWYRIRTASDKALARAAKKGKLAIGRKVAIAGARLEGGQEGKEVLRAYHSSVLKIGGNSASLASWDARLGFQPRPYVASLRSLTADGGPIALLDVQVLKLFPVGFVETDQAGRSSRPCDQSGEDEAHRAWEESRANEASKWRIQFEAQLERMKAAIDKLGYAAKGVSLDPDATPPSDAEDFLEELLDAECDVELLKTRRFLPTSAAWLASEIQVKYREKHDRREEDMERELMAVCPPRKVRNFRVAVIKDARILQKPTARTAQLTVWDVLSFEGDALRVGQRYLLANVQPSQQGSWRRGDDAADIYLSTRRDTKWTAAPSI